MYTFVSNKYFGQSLDISTKNLNFLRTFNSEFSYFEVLFTNQNYKPFDTEDNIKINLVIK